MRALIRLLLAGALVFCSGSAIAQLSTPTAPNGCGSGWSRFFTPNSLPLLKCEFKSSCDGHDVCYGRCETSFTGECEYRRCRPGGDLHNKSECQSDERLGNLQARATVRRQTCDQAFYRQLRTVNAGRTVCEAFAIVYRDAVKNFGAGFFSGIDTFEGPPQPQAEYEGAIREFFENGSEAQFRQLVQAADQDRPIVNLKRPISFSRNEGLTNKSTDRKRK
jgi:hypothetical protein